MNLFLIGCLTGLVIALFSAKQIIRHSMLRKLLDFPLIDIGQRVMFLPDTQRPCFTLIESLQRNNRSARKPCARNGHDCVYYHGWPGESPCALAEVLKTLYYAEESKRKKTINVRILTDYKHTDQENDQIPGLKEAGIDVRLNPKASMHNKYCIVDKRVMISGSSNWTHAAFSTNDEMILWNKNPEIVEEVTRKFTRAFNSFK